LGDLFPSTIRSWVLAFGHRQHFLATSGFIVVSGVCGVFVRMWFVLTGDWELWWATESIWWNDFTRPKTTCQVCWNY